MPTGILSFHACGVRLVTEATHLFAARDRLIDCFGESSVASRRLTARGANGFILCRCRHDNVPLARLLATALSGFQRCEQKNGKTCADRSAQCCLSSAGVGNCC